METSFEWVALPGRLLSAVKFITAMVIVCVRRCMTIISRAVSILISSAVSLCVEFVLSAVDIASYNGNVILGISQWREQ